MASCLNNFFSDLSDLSEKCFGLKSIVRFYKSLIDVNLHAIESKTFSPSSYFYSLKLKNFFTSYFFKGPKSCLFTNPLITKVR